MAFQNIPLKSIGVDITSVAGIESLPWYNPSDFPVQPGNPYPTPIQRDFRWRITFDVDIQTQSSYITRNPGLYNGFDINIGQWIASINTGQAWQIISVESKTALSVTAIVQDIYRYNTFADSSSSGNGAPSIGTFIVFTVSDAGLPQIDPVPPAGISSSFTQNINSRFQYINLQYDYPLYQPGNTFQVNDVIAADPDNHTWVLADATYKTVIGRITSISDIIPGWFTFNPVQKIVDFLDWLPGNVADTIYTSVADPGQLTILPGGSPIYIKLRNNTQSETTSLDDGPTTPGNVFQLNDIDITVGGTGDSANLISAVNLQSANTGVSANSVATETTVQTNYSLLSGTYGEVVLYAASSPATATINGTLVTFNITSTNPGYEDYAQAPQMAQAINAAAPTNIVAAAVNNGSALLLTNTAGGAITIVNGNSDTAGVPFAGSGSGSGLALSTSASSTYKVKFTAVDARAIDFLDVVGSTTTDYGLVSVENGIKAAGLYIEGGIRQATTTVVADFTALYALSPLIGDQAYVIDSDDGLGNNVGQWSMWLYDGADWVQTQTQAASESPGKTIWSIYNNLSVSGNSVIGTIQTSTRVTTITVYVSEAFDGPATLDIGYDIGGVSPQTSVDGLMPNSQIDLNVVGTYTTTSNIVFGNMTTTGDVNVVATFDPASSSTGIVRVTVSYV